MNFLSITIAQTGSTKLTPDPNTLGITAISFCVQCFLAALVTGTALQKTKLNFRTLSFNIKLTPLTNLKNQDTNLLMQAYN